MTLPIVKIVMPADLKGVTPGKLDPSLLRKIVGGDIAIAIAGNKCDLEKNRNVEETEAIQYAESVGAAHFNTSAKANKGLNEVFNNLATNMMTKRSKNGGADGAGGKAGAGGRSKQKLVIVDDTPSAAEKKPGACC